MKKKQAQRYEYHCLVLKMIEVTFSTELKYCKPKNKFHYIPFSKG